jgi:hypothetical protein
MDQVRKEMADRVQLAERNDPETLALMKEHGVEPADLKAALAELNDPTPRKKIEEEEEKAIAMPRDAVAGALQTGLQNFYEERKPELLQRTEARGALALEVPVTDESLRPEAADAKVEKLFERFSRTDIGWATVGIAKLVTLVRNKRAFQDRPAAPLKIADNARVYLIGDWASGVPRARAVSERIRTLLVDPAFQNVEQHVIHLGDAYYSGFQKEYESSFLKYWPVLPGEEGKYGSWSVNGNHDMYSGGHAYFDFLLADPRFRRQEQSSYFSLENANWQILGLDTAWDDKDLTGGQAKWVADTRRANRKKKGMLMSHHQLFCAYSDDQNPKIRAKLDQQGVLGEGLVDSWFWGHEHLCALYEPRDNVRFARLVGHGGIPEYVRLGAPPPTVSYQFQEFFESGLEKFARFGFAVLEFAGASVQVQYISELGQVHKVEVLT